MAKITQVQVSYGRTFNLENYNSARIDAQLTAELEPGDDARAVMGDLWNQAKEEVKAQVRPLIRKQHERAVEVFAGLPIELQEEIANGHNRPD